MKKQLKKQANNFDKRDLSKRTGDEREKEEEGGSHKGN